MDKSGNDADDVGMNVTRFPRHRRRLGRSSGPALEFHGLEPLEPRLLMSVFVTIDYSLDTHGFFNDPSRRDLLQSIADDIVSQFGDTLSAINPGSGNTWTATFDHPGTGANHQINNLEVGADEIIIFAGGSDLPGSTLGQGGSGGFSASGTQQWLDTVSFRGESGAGDEPATDFGPWGGAITFDTSGTTWHFGTTTVGLSAGESDFMSVAYHELIHLFGFSFGTDSFRRFVSAGAFNGPAAMAEYDPSGAVPLHSDASHWDGDVTDRGQPVAMDPVLTQGTRVLPTPLDYSALDDLGWEVISNLPQITIAETDGESSEAGGDQGTLTVTRTGPTDLPLTVNYTVGGTATDGTDYQRLTGTLVIGAGNASAGITVTPIDDNRIENNETVIITLDSGPGYAVGDADAAEVDINDDDFVDPSITFGSIRLPGDLLVPGDTGKALVNLVNLGNATASGTAMLELLAVQTGGAEIVLVTRPAQALKIPGGGTQGVNLKFRLPADLASGEYSLRARLSAVNLAGGVAETDASNNTVTGDPFDVAHQFGTFGDRANVKLLLADDDGTVAKVSIKGPGTGAFTGSDLLVTGTTSASKINVKTKGGDGAFTLGNVELSDLKNFTGRAVDLSGDLAAGNLGSLTLRHVGGGNGITLASALPVAIRLGRVNDMVLTSAAGIKKLTVIDWLDGVEPDDQVSDELIAPWVGKLIVKGDKRAALPGHIEADVTLSGVESPNGVALGKAVVKGLIRGVEIRSAGGIGSITAVGLHNSLIFAGVNPALSTTPDSLDDFVAPVSISRVTIKGDPGEGLANLIGSQIAARTLGSLNLGRVDAMSIAADRLNRLRYSHREPPDSHTLSRLDKPGDFSPEDDESILIRIL